MKKSLMKFGAALKCGAAARVAKTNQRLSSKENGIILQRFFLSAAGLILSSI